MSLTSGRGPLSPHRDGRFTMPVPDGVAYVEPFRRRVTATAGGAVVVDSEAVLLVHRPGGAPVWAFPSEHVSSAAAEPSPDVAGYVELPWDAVDAWFQEDREVLLHAPNPYHRVEYLPCRRRLRVTADDAVLADTAETVAVFETALPPRLYVAPEHVRMDRLTPTDTTTFCPYKGTATYWTVAGTDIGDVAWTYAAPLPEAAAIAGLLSFYDDRVTVDADLPDAAAIPGPSPA